MKNHREPKTTKDALVTPVVAHVDPDTIADADGSHPVATGLGVAAGAVAGAAVGAVAGPVGAVAGGVVGAVTGGFAGKAAAEAFDPTAEETYWRTTYTEAPYYVKTYSYDDYGPAYRLGWESRARGVGQSFEEAEGDLSRAWNDVKASSRLGWDDAKSAVRAAWRHASDTAERLAPGDSDHDGK